MRHVVTHCILYKRSREQEREGERERKRPRRNIVNARKTAVSFL